jgi:hypothetical protein
MTMDILMISLGVVVGFALCWFVKDNIIEMATGAEAFAARLETKAASIKAALK